MVNNISFNGGYTNFKQYENAAKYALGTTIVTPEESPFMGMGIMMGIVGLQEVWKSGKWVYTNRKDLPEAWKQGKEIYNTDLATKKALLGNGGWKKLDTYKQIWNNYSANTLKQAIPTKEGLEGLSPKTKKLYEKAEKIANMAKEKPARARKLLSMANAKFAEAEAAANAEKLLKPVTGFKKFTRFLGKYTGITKLNGGLKNFATKSPLTAKFLKYGKSHGLGLFFAIEGISALFTIIPAFTQVGFGSGVKQTGKSIVKAGASIGGWVAGATAGAAIGSIIPGAGTILGGAIGAAAGMIGGCLGSWATGKIVEPLCKSEVDIAKEKEAKKIAEEASKDPQKAQELMATVAQKLQAEGTDSEDAKIALASIQNIVQSQPTQYAQSFSGNSETPNSNTTSSNPFASNEYMNKDFMAMGAGLA